MGLLASCKFFSCYCVALYSFTGTSLGAAECGRQGGYVLQFFVRLSTAGFILNRCTLSVEEIEFVVILSAAK